MKLFTPAVLVFALIQNTFAQETASYTKVATRLVELINAADYSGVEKLFNKLMSQALPLSKATQFFAGMNAQFGKIQKLDEPRQNAGWTVFPAHFERGLMDMSLALDREDRIAGLLFKARTATEQEKHQTQLAQTDRYTKMANRIVELINAGDYADIQTNFNKVMDALLPLDKSSEFFKDLTQQAGKIQKLGEPQRVDDALGSMVFPAKFEKDTFDMEITLDNRGLIASIDFTPHGATKPEPEQYTIVVNQLVKLINAGDYAGIQTNFSKEMATALPLDKASEFFKGLTQQVGKIQKLGKPQDYGEAMVFPAECEKGALDMLIALDGRGLIALFTLTPHAATKPEPEKYAKVANRLKELLNAGHYAGIQTNFNKVMDAVLPLEKSSEFFKELTQQAGKIQKLGEPRPVGDALGSMVFPAKFERDTLDMEITLDDSGKIAGLVVRAQEDAGIAATKQILDERIEKEKGATCMVVGIIDEQGTNIVACGKIGLNSPTAVDGDTVFEIGSVSKVFTSVLLADMGEKGEGKLDDPIAKSLPASVKVPVRKGRPITLEDLATHTSGLPRLPDNLEPADDNDPYADYTVQQMYDFLSKYTIERDIGAKYEYSNFGGGLLGHILALRAGTNYEALLQERICRPLGMTSTSVALSPAMKSRLAQGHDDKGRAVANWNLPTLAGAGGIRSTANDMLKFAAASLGLSKTSLAPAMALAETPRHEAGSATTQIGLGWHVTKRFGSELTWHNGGTGGYHSYIGLDKQKKRAVLVLANSSSSIEDIGQHLLEPQYALRKVNSDQLPREPGTIKLAPAKLDAYAGKYELQPGVLFSIKRSGDRLLAQLTGQTFLEIFPTSETEFFYKAVDAQLTFEKDAQGEFTDLILHQNGIDQTAHRVK